MAQRSLVVNFIGDDASLQASFKRIGASTNALESAGRRMSSVGSSMTRNVTLPILAIGGAAAKMSLDFQSSTERLRTQAGASQAQVEKLRQGMLNMAASVATSPNQLSAGMYHVVSSMNAVLAPTQRVSGELTVLKVAAELAKVGGADLEETSYALASAMNALHAPISQTSKVAGTLNAIVGAGDMTMQDLIDSFQSGLVPAARVAGLSLQSLGAALAVMGDVGMRGALAGTRLRMSIALLASPSAASAKVLETLGLSAKEATSTSSAMAAALEKAGLRTTQLGADLKKPDGFMVALKDLNDHLRESGLTATGAAALMSKAFGGGRQGAAITLLAQNTDRLKIKFDQIGQTASKFGTDFAATTQTASFKWHAMLVTVDGDAIRLGSAVLPVLLGVGKQILSVVTGVAHAFESLPKGAQQTIITGGLIVATIGPALKILGLFTGAIGKLYALTQLATGARLLGSGGIVPVAGAKGAAMAAESAAASGGLLAGVRGIASKAVGGLAIGGLGVLISQTVGSAIHGGVGQGIKTIGTDASIGAGMGAIFGPPGIAGGAMIGGLVGSFQHFIIGSAANEGREFANRFLAPLPNAIQAKFAKPLADAANKATADFRGAAAANSEHIVKTATGETVAPGGHLVTGPALSAQARKDAFNLGWLTGQATIAGLKSVKVPSTAIFANDFILQLRKLPAQARPEAAKVMLEYAHGLQANKELPKGAVNEMIGLLEGAFPALQGFLRNQGLQSDKSFGLALKFTNSMNILKGTVANFRSTYGDMAISSKLTNANINQNTHLAMIDLQTVIVTSVGKTRRDAIAELHRLQAQTKSTFTTMGAQVASAASDMHQSVKDGSALAYRDGAANWTKFAKSIAAAVGSGILSAQAGSKAIGDALNAVLKSFGEKPLALTQIKGLPPDVLRALASGQVSAGGIESPHARGGLVQFGRAGDRGADSIPVNMGGVPIVVGSGEVGAVLTGDQQAFLNARTADVGGLPGVFSAFRTQHSQTRRFASGGMVRGFATGGPVGGALSYGQLEGLWEQGGGPANAAPTAAAIALAESSGRDVMQQGQPFATTGWGYWQITPGGPQYLDPLTNAWAAVAKWLAAGKQFTPWTTFNDGAFRQFLHGAVPALGGMFASIRAPKVTGSGTIADIVRGALGLEAKGANAYLSRLAPAGPSGTGPSGGGFTPSQLGSFDGLQVAKWIIPELAWARAHGWAGQVTSGYRSPSEIVHGVFATAPQGQSEHRLDVYPGGAVDVSDYQQFAQIIRGYPGAQKLIQLGIDPLHFSGTGHAHGGLVAGDMASRALGAAKGFFGHKTPDPSPRLPSDPKLDKLRHGRKRHAQKPRKPRRLGIARGDFGSDVYDVLGKDGPFPFSTGDYAALTNALGPILALDGTAAGSGSQGGAAQKLADLIQFKTQLWESSLHPPSMPGASDTFASWADPSAFVLSSDALGNTVAPYISPKLPGVTAELGQIVGWQQRIVNDLHGSLGGSHALIPHIHTAIRRRVAETRKITRRVRANIEKIKGLQKKIKDERAKKAPSKQSIAGWNKEIGKLETENQKLVGAKGSIPSTPGGELGQIAGQLGSRASGGNIETVLGTGAGASGLYALLSTVKDWIAGLRGPAGDLAQQGLQLSEYKLGLSGLDPSGKALAAALRTASVGAGTTPQATLSGTVGFAYQGQDYLAGLGSGGLIGSLGKLPPFGGSFAGGGIVPGRPGEPRTIIAHGGEEYLGVGGERKTVGASGFADALGRLTGALAAHEASVRQLTQATNANTSATRGSRIVYGHGYSSLSSDEPTALHVGG